MDLLPSTGLAATGRLLVLARDLLQASDLRSCVDLVGRAFQELMAAEEALLIMRLADQELDAAFDRAGFLRSPDRSGSLYHQARQAMVEQTPIVQPQMAAIPVTPASVVPNLEGEGVVTFPFPPFHAKGVLAGRWDHASQHLAAPEQQRVLRYLGELAGAALGNVELRLMLETQVVSCRDQVASSAQEYARELQRRDQLEEEIRRISDTDVLTGLLNRRGFHKHAEQSYKMAKRQNLPAILLFADVDGLKAVNDQFGHDVGDRLIQDCAWILRNSFRDSDVLARFGGDEFAAFTFDTAQPEGILLRIQENVESYRRHTDRPYQVSFSTGVVRCDPAAELGLSDYIGMADQEMYRQKRRRLM
ncbi:MAG TPA: GGDEF domain-containing protein [Rhodocyclaceae bacterium]|nr:GGDEF domain-containing protein [Rhodocyclaceae bacterium]